MAQVPTQGQPDADGISHASPDVPRGPHDVRPDGVPVLSGPGARSDDATAADDAAAVEGRGRTVAHAKVIQDVQAAFETINSERVYLPTTLFMNGAYLNKTLGVDTYDPAKGYVCTVDDIRESTSEDEL